MHPIKAAGATTVDEPSLIEGSPDVPPSQRRAGARRITGGTLLATAVLASLLSLTAGQSSPPLAGGPTTATTAPAPTGTLPVKAPVPAPQGSPPLHITYPAVDMDQNILPLTPATQGPGSTIVPPLTAEAYWLTPYGSPGSDDTTYIIGHSWEGRDTAFNHLSARSKTGDRLTVTTTDGPTTYTVTTVSTENKSTLKDSPIWNKVPNRVILISCYTADLWGTNIVITADRAPTP